ncbi:MAG: response regulator [Leptospira sp.]|nr:response regulator [Leptospira sp.]
MFKLIKVLLAEDDENSAMLVKHAMDRFNFDVTHVPDGMAALSKVRTNDYDLIISDIMMPYLDGLSFIEKAQDFIRDTPVIVLTAVGERKNVLRAAQRHVKEYILKPIEIDALLEKVLIAMKMETTDLFVKKDKPLKINVSETGENLISLKLEGCPKKNSADEIYNRVHNIIETSSHIKQLFIEVDTHFFLEALSYRILDDFMLKLIKNTDIRGSGTTIYAPEIREARLDPDKFPNLLSCKIETRS